MTTNPLTELYANGQSPWLDFILRSHMQEGKFRHLIDAGEIYGATSNPSIFEKAIGGSADYDDQLRDLVNQGFSDPRKIFDELAITDIQAAADNLRPVFDRTAGADGYISLEVSPGAAGDTQASINEAKYLWQRANRPNVMIKIPATPEGIPAIEQLLADGLNINITLIFALDVYAQVVEAFLKGLERRAAAGQSIDHIASVASFFVSRVDTEIDKRLDALIAQRSNDADNLRALQGKAAIANAKLAYEHFRQIFNSPRFTTLRAQGARPQRCLWASTSTKNPKYRDVLYVEQLIGPETVNTMPPATIDAFRDHGEVRQTLVQDVAGAHTLLDQLAAVGVVMADVTQKLLVDGVKLFADAYDQLMEETGKKVAKLREETGGAPQSRGAGFQASLSALGGIVEHALQRLDEEKAGERLWNRDATFWKSDSATGEKIRNRLGWLEVARKMENGLRDLEGFANEVHQAGFTDAVLLGMGGSSLCPEVFRTTFGKKEGFPTFHVLDSTDPETLLATEHAIDIPRTLFIVASKSGTTLETLSHFRYFYDKVKATKEDAGANFVTITDPGTPLEELASRLAFRATFRNPPDIGGRYSALSYFGLVPAAVMGVDVGALLDSALQMAKACDAAVPAAQNPGLHLGAILGMAATNGRDKVTIIAAPPVASIGLWIEQLIAESTGKEGRGIVPIAGEPLGAPSVYDEDRLFAYIRTDEGFDPAQDAALDQLEAAGHPVVRTALPNRYALAGEFYRWEMATAIAGHFLDINPFDEPNVQESKDNTKHILDEYAQQGHLATPAPLQTFGTLDISAGEAMTPALRTATSQAQVRDAIVATGQHGDYIAIMAYVQPTAEVDALLQRLRVYLRDASKLATTLGYGPRFLHSTGQLHKGGANSGIFIQIVAHDRADASIPGENYTFGTLIHAQSLGDYASLQSHQRRVIRIDLGNDITGGLNALLAQ